MLCNFVISICFQLSHITEDWNFRLFFDVLALLINYQGHFCYSIYLISSTVLHLHGGLECVVQAPLEKGLAWYGNSVYF